MTIASLLDGEVINADSMQVYRQLPILSAMPDRKERGDIPHHLFGHVDANHAYSVAEWLSDTRNVLENIGGAVPVLAGGTGLYFKALTEGIADIPPIDPIIREKYRAVAEEDPERLHALLSQIDPISADQLKPGDAQRIVRALEVVESTGKPIGWWQHKVSGRPVLQAENSLKIVILPHRDVLKSRIAERFRRMVEAGALEEVAKLVAAKVDPRLPAMRAIGVPQLSRYLAGELSLDAAVDLAVTASRQYAKRQFTWFRNQLDNKWQGFSTAEAAIEALFTGR